MFYIHRAKNNQFYFTINARNGQVLATSEPYTRKLACKHAIARVVAKCADGIATIIDKTK